MTVGMEERREDEYLTEADVETKFIYRVLIHDILQIPEKQVHFHFPVNITQGREKKVKEADIVIKNEKDENVIVFESKSPDEPLEKYISQVDSYAFYLETPISVLSNYYRTIVRVYLSGNKKEIVLDKEIASLKKDHFEEFKRLINLYQSGGSGHEGGESPVEEKRKNIVTDYRRLFRQIHTKIRSMDKLDPSASFDEFSKILFIKIINDRIPEEARLTVERIQVYGTTQAQTKYIDDWFHANVEAYYPGIFADNEKIAASPGALCAVLEILEAHFNLKDSFTDIKGRAFEEFLPSQLRGKGLGQFFTPRPLVEFMVELADIGITDRVLDFASGSGGFLIRAFDKKRQLVNETQQQYLDLLQKSREELYEEIKLQIFGIDAEPRAVRTAKMNMLLWGDGKQIQHGNGLDTKDFKGESYFAKEYKKDDPNSGVHIILANPPFGSTEEDPDILKNYTLSGKEKKKGADGKEYIVNKKEKTENLFVEKAYKMLRPNGKLLIVLPEGIFSNGDSRVRNFILSHFQIKTIVKLPKHTFVMSGVDTINTVILMAVKNTEERMERIIESDRKTWVNEKESMVINFALVNQIGYEPSGKTLLKGYESSDLKVVADKILKEAYSEVLADPITFADLEFGDDNKVEAYKKPMIKFLRMEFDKVPERLDPTWYFFHEETKEILKTFVHLNLTEENMRKTRLTEKELYEDVERIYKYVSVVKTPDGAITETEEKTVDELLSSKKESMPQKLFQNDIVFNPYRINTGSIIYIDSDEENLITSPAYVVLRNMNFNAKYLVQLLKTPFFKYQIQVLASGSVRDNFSGSGLYALKVPNISEEEQREKLLEVDASLRQVKECALEIEKHMEHISRILTE